jgi:pSer/pThr/pTyr-binding forkhead associated (FHA) protein
MDESHPFFTIGRSDHCCFVVKDKGVSRLHARIEYRKGKFVLTDVSRNGTLIVNDRGGVSHVHRDEFLLTGCGCIRVGVKEQGQERRILKYSCRHGCKERAGPGEA